MRWFDVNLTVVFKDVVIDMYIPVKVDCFFKKCLHFTVHDFTFG